LARLAFDTDMPLNVADRSVGTVQLPPGYWDAKNTDVLPLLNMGHVSPANNGQRGGSFLVQPPSLLQSMPGMQGGRVHLAWPGPAQALTLHNLGFPTDEWDPGERSSGGPPVPPSGAVATGNAHDEALCHREKNRKVGNLRIAYTSLSALSYPLGVTDVQACWCLGLLLFLWLRACHVVKVKVFEPVCAFRLNGPGVVVQLRKRYRIRIWIFRRITLCFVMREKGRWCPARPTLLWPR
jgi:hypothetical protein